MAQGGISNKPENSVKSLKEVLKAQRAYGAKHPTLKILFALIQIHNLMFVSNRIPFKLTF